MANLKFEDAMARLEEIVNGLEKGDLSLDKSLKMFEEGVRLSKSCLKMLDEAQQKVEILVRDREGKKKVRPFRLKEAETSPTDTEALPEDMEGSLEEANASSTSEDEEENE
jgi:exodeoxyribonuclease VII small subunit